METQGRRYFEFPELALRALRYLAHDVEPMFQQDKHYAGASKYQISRKLGHTQHPDTVDDIIKFLMDQNYAVISTSTGKWTYYRATQEGITFVGNYYMTFSDFFEAARKSRGRTRRHR